MKLSPQGRDRIKYTLKGLKELALKDKVIIPHFGGEDWICESVHGRSEAEHKCDVVLTLQSHRDVLRGIQLKTEDIDTKTYISETILVAARRALGYEFNGNRRLHSFYWITTGKKSALVGKWINDWIERDPLTGGRVTIWDIDDLVNNFHSRSPLFRDAGLFEAIRNESEAVEHNERHEGVFASMLFYRSFCWHLQQQHVEIARAGECIQNALASIRAEMRPRLFYSRTLTEFYSMWAYLLDTAPDKVCKGGADATSVLNEPEIIKLLEVKYQNSKAQLVSGLAYAMDQLNQLQRHYLNGPAGLSTLQICRLLLRAGISPKDPELETRFLRIRDDLRRESEQSIDGGCSLCTGTAVSCFALAGQRDEVRPAVEWLNSLQAFRYCHLPPSYYDAKKNEHALHYAATVMTALSDFDPTSQEIKNVVDVFFANLERTPDGFFKEWIRYANIDNFELYSYILGQFLQYRLSGLRLSEAHNAAIHEAITTLVKGLERDEVDAGAPRRFRYAARLNLCSLCLGLLLECDCAITPSKDVAAIMYRRACFVSKNNREDGGFCELWDSNIDRTRVMVEGYFQFLETLSFIEEMRGSTATAKFLPDASGLKVATGV